MQIFYIFLQNLASYFLSLLFFNPSTKVAALPTEASFGDAADIISWEDWMDEVVQQKGIINKEKDSY